MKRTETVKRDNFLVDYLLEHKGQNNAVSATEISEYLTANNFPTAVGNIHTLITKLKMERHLPICSTIADGYFWAKSRAEIQAFIDHLQSRIDGLQEHIEHLKNFIME